MAQKETHNIQMGKQGRKLSIIGLYSSCGLYMLYKTQQWATFIAFLPQYLNLMHMGLL